MDEEAKMDPGLIKKFFEMGLMGIETPESFGGAGGSFSLACLAIEELGRVDASCSVLVDVQNTLVTNAFLNYANDAIKKKYLPQLARSWAPRACRSLATRRPSATACRSRSLVPSRAAA
jgi:butyryl-CoA dehydrogenase